MRMDDLEKGDPVTTFLIGDPLCRDAGLAAVVSGSEVTVFPSRRRSNAGAPSPFAPCEPRLTVTRREIALFHPVVRKLVNESNGAFLSLQKIGERPTRGDRRPELLKISRQYRAIVRACLETLHEAIEAADADPAEADSLKSLVNTFYTAERVWHACEILHVDGAPGDAAAPAMLEWVRVHFPNHERAASAILDRCELGAEDDPDYWNAVTGMVMQGRIDIARALLKLHSDRGTNLFAVADNILNSMPIYDAYSATSINEFKVGWKHWQLVCESKINAKTFQSEPHLEHIMRLITGQRSAMEAARLNYTSWWELFGAWMLYAAPGSRRGDLGRAARDCANVRPTGAPLPEPTPLDTILLALMEDDLHRVLHDVQQLSDNGWLATHLTDLLVHCGKLKILDENLFNVTDQLRDSLVLDYGSLLGGHRSLWSVGFSYLARAANNSSDSEYNGEGLHRISCLLLSQPLGTEKRVMSLLHEAKKYNLPGVAESICQRQAMAMARKGRDGDALNWALRGRAAPLAARLADTALRKYAETGHLGDTDLIDNLGVDMMISDRLIFLAKYSEFHRHYKNGDFKEAGALIISLLSSKITPNYFWSTLLMDALPLLECDEVVFGADDTYEIMHCLEERVAGGEADDKIELLRLASSRNLARTSLLDDVGRM